MRRIVAAALAIATLAGPALAEGAYPYGPSAVPAASPAPSDWQARTPLAGAVDRGRAALTFLERSGTTGGGGQQN